MSSKKFSVFVGWFTIWLYTLIGLLMFGGVYIFGGHFTYLWALGFSPYSFPLGQIIAFPCVFGAGFIFGQLLYFSIPPVREIKDTKKITGAMFLILLAFFVWMQIRQQHPDYTHYIEAQCNSVRKTWLNQYANKEQCFHEVAVATKNPLICNNIASGSEMNRATSKEYCLYRVAEAAKDSKICEEITGTRRDDCYGSFLMCEKMIDSGWRKNCEESRDWQKSHPNGY